MVDLANLIIALTVMGAIAFYAWRHKSPSNENRYRKPFARENQMTGDPSPPLSSLDIAKVFSDRANALRKMANRVLVAIVLVIGGGIAVFSLAYTLSNNAGSPVNLDELTTHLSKLQTSVSLNFKGMSSAASYLIEELEVNGCGTKGGSTPWLYSISDKQMISDFGENTLKQIANDSRFENFNLNISVRSQWISNKEDPTTTPTDVLYVNRNNITKCISILKTTASAKEIVKIAKQANSNIAELTSTWRILEAAYGAEDKATLAKIESNSTTQSMYSVIHTNVTRIGSLVMIIFLVTILAPLYRYCLRLAAFYDARADALLLQHANVTTASFPDIATSMTPTLDFGSPPQSPLDQLVSLVRELRGSDKGGKSTDEKKEG